MLFHLRKNPRVQLLANMFADYVLQSYCISTNTGLQQVASRTQTFAKHYSPDISYGTVYT
jgi:hypothetical protein